MGTVWLTDEQQRAWRAYLRMQARLTAELNRQLQAGSGMSLSDYEVLVQLTDAPAGRLRPYELQKALEWEQSRLSHHLGRMQRRDLIVRQNCDDDGRGAYIVVTDTGREAIAAAAPGHVTTVRRLFFDHLDAEEVRLVGQLSDGVLAALDTAAGPST
ncbi:MarR family winged helix-turn-helix transcriptional regulator [Couchioplanes caeruleus]|uniref:MarR family transcriptional regulator n=2 Tax=Couchioplanes caeruleus TaxID=56438 RepID=A0A1K0FHW3_9ACTN|nr:MarR family transcriptional regulator [Couchioplanes caeruleus]OJF12417.1 MarR family transcriptional regulator [Couchioplanes caeruleus subsp. caeruleus]